MSQSERNDTEAINNNNRHQNSDESNKDNEIIINFGKETALHNEDATTNNKSGADSTAGTGSIQQTSDNKNQQDGEKSEDGQHNNNDSSNNQTNNTPINSQKETPATDNALAQEDQYPATEFALNSLANLAKSAASFLCYLGGNIGAIAKSPTTSSESSKKSSPVRSDPIDYSTFNDDIVRLNVYGLPGLNQVINYTGLGVYHSGVQIYGIEYAYGGCPYPQSSIFHMPPRDIRCLSDISGRFQFVETIIIGKTHFSRNEVGWIIWNMGQNGWIGTNYHMLYKNCNTFSDQFCRTLCNNPIPNWINRLAYIFSRFPFLIEMLPPEYFTPAALKDKVIREQSDSEKQVKEKKLSENEESLSDKCPPQRQVGELPKRQPVLTSSEEEPSLLSADIRSNDSAKSSLTIKLPMYKLQTVEKAPSPPGHSKQQTDRTYKIVEILKSDPSEQTKECHRENSSNANEDVRQPEYAEIVPDLGNLSQDSEANEQSKSNSDSQSRKYGCRNR